ncbi:glucose dehydrogenase [FAD, quinone]-like [Epargyreus clarus]|uniref:glucose dehydrogenase [FAD, quinone]-like n=1 Tax=Epargyreus clarus TaxID=520877 RepID=UPI003C2B5A0A
MTPIIFQWIIFSICINLFTLFAYFVYYGDLLASTFQNKLQREYDFIIVGAGTAGSLIAHRLATETNHTFVVLEAGSKSHALLEIPVLGPLLHGSVHDWQFETVPQTDACLAMVDNKCMQTQGKIVGGSSKLNNMIHVQGNISHYVNWFQGIYTKEYFKKQFNFLEHEIININYVQHESELSDIILNAANELGYDAVSKEFKEGFMKSRLSQKDGRRWTTSDNLDISKYIVTNTCVEKMLIKNKKCVGVKIANKLNELYAKKGVILSAGAFNSPKILQLSGIGPAKLLKSLNIPIVKDLPVGKNLQDHIGSGLDLVLFEKSLSVSPWNMLNPLNIFKYFLQGKGPFTSSGCEVVGFLSTKNDTIPDIQFMVLPTGISADRGSKLKNNLALKDSVWQNYFAKLFDKHTATIFATILHPKSKGEVFIASKDPFRKPLIDPKYFSNKNDIEVLVNGFKLVKQFVETDAMKGLGAEINPIPFPGCEKDIIFSDSYWECYVRHLTLTSYHPVGTCSMGLPHSKKSVVDTSFKVIGIEGLFVADSSVLPSLPSGNINAAVAMMASVFFESNIKLKREGYKRKGYFCPKDNVFLKTCVT